MNSPSFFTSLDFYSTRPIAAGWRIQLGSGICIAIVDNRSCRKTPPQPPLATPDPEPSSPLLELEPLDSFLASDTDGSSSQTQLHSVPIAPTPIVEVTLAYQQQERTSPPQPPHLLVSVLQRNSSSNTAGVMAYLDTTTLANLIDARCLPPGTPLQPFSNDLPTVCGRHRQPVNTVARAKHQITFVAPTLSSTNFP
ncbi:hypothetical protein M427DRAFT_29634 [Gonapodya prolifera JEL478]|uniref:Uncharacterized protein n=1 Tax=Gonapodya prolifera (strain JEL478) TaxID=1344416 RepID=A0A139APU6_GONPJ|nr:hypothetical protein M427DRAFT_29634 [Gonapodya prolifera JEL478]|eukprot:KXS18748.1 hypothetical protein M427DRAFT_29634 [Gonapodya prolifera JEL478]